MNKCFLQLECMLEFVYSNRSHAQCKPITTFFLLNKMIRYNNTHGTLNDIHIYIDVFPTRNGSTKIKRGFFIGKITFLDISTMKTSQDYYFYFIYNFLSL